MFKKILVPLDGSTRAERAISVAARLARARGGSVVLVRAMSFSSMYGPGLAFYPTVTPSMVIEEQEAEKHYLSHAASSPEVAGIPIETIHSQGDAASAILAAAEATQADLIVLCSHGRTGFMRWALGSVAEKVAHHASMPVLILRDSGSVPSAPHPDPTSPLRALVPLDGSALAKAVLEPVAQLIA
ncbi:MAG: universal stress protein, partial [Ktedonobacteraceae bacterium]|nr:universal stress protein [Ktedonobacteraceae bacterium]